MGSAAPLSSQPSALIGASEAVWLLAPKTRSERLKRARILAAYAVKHHAQYLSALQQLDRAHENTDFVAEHTANRKAELFAKRDSLGERTKLDTTLMIKQAAEAAFCADLAVEASLEWQAGSGAAHGLAWS